MLFFPKMSVMSHAAAPMIPALGSVITHAMTHLPDDPPVDDAPLLPRPTPITPPETTWVVDRGYP